MKIKKLFTLRLSILTIYSATFIILITILITTGSLAFVRSMSYVSHTLLENTSNLVIKELRLKTNAAETLSRFTQSLFKNDYINLQNMVDYTLYVAKNIPQAHFPYAVRVTAWGDSEGNSIETFLETDGTYSTSVIKPNNIPPVHIKYYRNATDTIINTALISEKYDPRTRPWYQEALKAGHFIWTDVFLSYPLNNLTTAGATPIYDKSGKLAGVFAIEIKLVDLSSFLDNLPIGKNGDAFIINANDELIAFPGMQKTFMQQPETNRLVDLGALNKPWLNASLKQFNKTHEEEFAFDYSGVRYLANFTHIQKFEAHGWKIGIVVPESDFTSVIEGERFYIAIVSLCILLLGILVASFFSKRISTPMKLLVNETEKIKNLNFDGHRVDSVIKEVDSLATAIYSMKMNLRSFQKYMPASLVKQLIQSGEDIQLGGDKKTLSIFFSDIKNFTSITENMDPDELMPHLCEYFDTVSKVITEARGTIDKFIGDSVMAFWGAPLADEYHCEHACRTALRCKNQINQLNFTWKQQGKKPYETRFGVHTGEVIVGNIGSSERMNYTALGDAINFTSRLEGMNKVYGTTIITSDQVFKLVGHKFVFRMLDRCAIKGKAGGYTIYELLAENPSQLSFDINAWQAFFDKGFQAWQQQNWVEALTYFKQCLTVFAEDSVAQVFIERTEYFIKNPPPLTWDGIWRERTN